MSALKSCPFCGGPAGVMKAYGEYIACCADPHCPALETDETEEAAINRWNTRAASNQPEGAFNADTKDRVFDLYQKFINRLDDETEYSRVGG